MSTYKGTWVQNRLEIPPDVRVTVDDTPLPAMFTEVPGTREVFGWSYLSPWANRKLLAHSLLFNELAIVMQIPKWLAHKYTIVMADSFVNDRIDRLAKQWTMTSSDIQSWIQLEYPDIWEELNTAATV